MPLQPFINQDELGLNMYDYGARNYDPALGRWMNIDPLGELYESNSSYVYTLNNPVLFIDPDGNHVDVSDILAKDKKTGQYKNKELAEAFLNFANSEAGIAFLSNFASKGQKIGNHTYGESGKFHKQGVDIAFTSDNLNHTISDDSDIQGDTGSNGTTLKAFSSKHLKINVVINSELNLNNEAAKDYKNDKKNRTGYVLDRTATIFHESYIHAQVVAEDFLDDCDVNESTIPSEVKAKANRAFTRVSNYSNLYHHLNAREKNSQYRKVVMPALIGVYKNYKMNLTKEQAEKKMFNYQN